MQQKLLRKAGLLGMVLLLSGVVLTGCIDEPNPPVLDRITSEVRFVHASPDAPAVDITLTDGTILFGAVAQMEGNAKFADLYWDQLTQWAEYLKAKGFDPENQLCTDDFAGHLAHNVGYRLQVFVVPETLTHVVDHGCHLTQRYQASVTAVHGELHQLVEMGALRTVEAEHDGHLGAAGRDVEQPRLGAVEGDPDGARHLLGGDAAAHGLDGHLDAAKGGHHDDDDPGVRLLDLLQDLEAVLPRRAQALIEQHEIDVVAGQGLVRLGPADGQPRDDVDDPHGAPLPAAALFRTSARRGAKPLLAAIRTRLR